MNPCIPPSRKTEKKKKKEKRRKAKIQYVLYWIVGYPRGAHSLRLVVDLVSGGPPPASMDSGLSQPMMAYHFSTKIWPIQKIKFLHWNQRYEPSFEGV